MFGEHDKDAPEHFEVVEAAWVGGGVVRHEEVEEEADCVLERDGEPVDVAPGGPFCEDS